MVPSWRLWCRIQMTDTIHILANQENMLTKFSSSIKGEGAIVRSKNPLTANSINVGGSCGLFGCKGHSLVFNCKGKHTEINEWKQSMPTSTGSKLLDSIHECNNA